MSHVDTWDSWTNSSNADVMNALDWIGVNSFPYYETGKGNNIKNAPHLFDRSYEATLGVANGKPVWVTETGWPSSGPDWDEAEANVENAKYFWDEVGCRQLFGKTSTFWYIMRDSNPDNKMQFAITKNLSTKPLFDLTCPTTFETDSKPSSAAPSSSPTASPTSGGSEPSSDADADAEPTGDNSDSSEDSGPSTSQAPSTENEESNAEDDDSAAMSVQAFTVATYAALAVTAGFFALF